MDEPTLAEEVRLLRRDVHALIEAQQQYVTKEILALKLEALAKDQEALAEALAEDRARIASISRWLWSGVVAPVIVGLFLYLLLGKAP
jgi:hypothetical protein